MRYKVTETAPSDLYGKPVKAGDIVSLSKKQAALPELKGHIHLTLEGEDSSTEDVKPATPPAPVEPKKAK